MSSSGGRGPHPGRVGGPSPGRGRRGGGRSGSKTRSGSAHGRGGYGRGGYGRGVRQSPRIPNNRNQNSSTNKRNVSNSSSKYSDRANSSRGTNSYATRDTSSQIRKLNGEKGAEAHTVAESSRIELTQLLDSFREDDTAHKIELPPNLTNTERKFVHEEANRLGLKSKSHGKGDDRKITVSKILDKNKMQDKMKDSDLPILKIGNKGSSCLFQHIKKFPVIKDIDDIDSQTFMNAPKQPKQNQQKYKAPTIPYNNNKKLRKKNKENSALPIEAFRDSILSIIQSNPITILSGDTGCGKSTQLPQFILSSNPHANIIITQPRRISAVSLADRISWELSEEVGNTVGYNIRMDSVTSPDRTRILFVTPGILLQKLESLHQFTHIILDEIHERDQYTEFLMMALRQKLQENKLQQTKLILMSATMPDRQQLIDYWNEVSQVGEIIVPGRMFPVQEFFLENILEMVNWEGEDWQQDQDLSRLDSDLAKLVGKTNTGGSSSRNGLVCVMCGRKGFSTAEELGSHVALCDGGTSDVVELEKRVREMKFVNDVDLAKFGGAAGPEEYEDYDLSDGEKSDQPVDDEEEHLDKWDGHSPFYAMDSAVVPNSSSLTQEQMLSQYQALNDDDRIDELLLLALLQFIIQSSFGDGAILIFFAGWNDITSFQMLLQGSPPFCNDTNRYKILPLHSGVNPREQKLAFKQVPKGVRKIVLATNIAETSVTIDDVSFVVDTGWAKEKNYDPHLKTSTLQPVWISKASAKQRKGRAGRTKPGVCFRLYSRRRFTSFRDNLESELLRTPLEQVALQCKKLNLAPGGEMSPDGIPTFLEKALTPPHPKSVTNAIELLIRIGAMYPETNELTNLGICLSQLSLEPRVGKMVLWSHILGCARGASSMAVAMSYKSPFVLPTTPSMRRNAEFKMVSLSNHSESDLMTILNALRARDNCMQGRGIGAFSAFCNANYLSLGTMQMISDLRRNVSRELVSIGFPPSNESSMYHNRFGDSDPALLQAGIAAGLYPNVAMRKRGDANFLTSTNLKAKVHIGSVNACKGQRLSGKCAVKDGEVEFVAFNEMVKGVSKFTMSQTTRLSSPLPLLLLCGETLSVRDFVEEEVDDDSDNDQQGGNSDRAVLSIDDWINFQCSSDVASSLVILRKRLEIAFAHLIRNPSSGLSMLSEEEMDAVNTTCVMLRSMYHDMSR